MTGQSRDRLTGLFRGPLEALTEMERPVERECCMGQLRVGLTCQPGRER